MSTSAKPFIACLPNGPYYLVEETEPRTVPYLQNQAGKTYATVRGVALCRCGDSANKPFCDGSHGVTGFSDAKSAERMPDRLDDYPGKAVTVHFNGGVCAHAAYCVNELPAVFKTDTDPWIDPDGAPLEALITQIERCPSGALSYSIGGQVQGVGAAEPGVTVVRDGPYAVRGGIGLVGQEMGEGASEERYALCRCGASKNKPFCDGSHQKAGFRDDA